MKTEIIKNTNLSDGRRIILSSQEERGEKKFKVTIAPFEKGQKPYTMELVNFISLEDVDASTIFTAKAIYDMLVLPDNRFVIMMDASMAGNKKTSLVAADFDASKKALQSEKVGYPVVSLFKGAPERAGFALWSDSSCYINYFERGKFGMNDYEMACNVFDMKNHKLREQFVLDSEMNIKNIPVLKKTSIITITQGESLSLEYYNSNDFESILKSEKIPVDLPAPLVNFFEQAKADINKNAHVMEINDNALFCFTQMNPPENKKPKTYLFNTEGRHVNNEEVNASAGNSKLHIMRK